MVSGLIDVCDAVIILKHCRNCLLICLPRYLMPFFRGVYLIEGYNSLISWTKQLYNCFSLIDFNQSGPFSVSSMIEVQPFMWVRIDLIHYNTADSSSDYFNVILNLLLKVASDFSDF